MHLVKCLLPFIIFPALCPAAEPWSREIRLSGGTNPGINKVEVTASGSSASAEGDPEIGFSIEPQFAMGTYFNDTMGFVGVVGAFYRSHEGTDKDTPSDNVTIEAFGVSLSPALSIRIKPSLWFEIGPTFAYGAGTRGGESGGSSDPEGTGPYLSFGGRIGAYSLLKEHLLFGMDVGYASFTNEDSVTISSTSVDTTTSGNGLVINFTIGYRL